MARLFEKCGNFEKKKYKSTDSNKQKLKAENSGTQKKREKNAWRIQY